MVALKDNISRQLIGNGFRLYQKVVSSKLSDDEDYSKALRGPLYSCIREALSSLEESRLNAEMQSSCFTNEVLPKKNDGGNPTSLEVEVHSSGEHFSEVPKKEDTGRTLTTPLRNSTAIQNISSAGSNSLAKEVNHNKVVPTSPLCSSKDGASEIPVEDNIMHSTNQIIFKTNDTHESSSSTRRKSMRQRRRGFCCFSISPTQIDS
ncbi:hypothetical protein M0R45_030010 [Rubus argutus]|uniref:Uncharacterized protein n=1 Tax=Rubus argutus TaxID=59490 RepID=A0AAW1WCA0_RUBAR